MTPLRSITAMNKLTPALAALAIALTGCSTQPETQNAEAQETTTQATTEAPAPHTSDRWAFDYYGGYAEFNLPTEEPSNEWAQQVMDYRAEAGIEEPSNEWAQQVMDYRAEAGIEEPIYWATIEADNTNGTQDFTADGFIFVTEDGQQVQSVEGASELLDEAQEAIDDTDFYNRGVDLYNERNDPIKPGAKADIPVAFYENVEPAHVYVVDGLSSELEAYPLP